jgi:iron complex outermembrane recepter protein
MLKRIVVQVAVVAALALGAGALYGSQAERPPVVGEVRSSEGEPLPRAQVLVMTTGRAMLTDAAGRFVLRLMPGRHRLQVSMLGYAPTTREVEIGAGLEEVTLTITLRPTPLSLPGVQVTATPAGRDALAVAQATSQLSGRALERNLGGTLARTLETQPGIATRYNGPAAAMPVMRGLTGERILILQDGQRTADLAGSAADHAVTVDPLAARRIEIVRGPASLLYGTNALGGVVNVIGEDIPPAGLRQPEWTASVQTESAYPGASGGLRGLLPLGERWALTMRGSARATGDVRIGRDPLLGTRLGNTFHENRAAAIGLGYGGERVAGGVSFQTHAMRYGLPLPPGEDEEIVLEGRRYSGSGRVDVNLGSQWFPGLRLTASATDYAHDELEDGELEMAFALRTQSLEVLLRQGASGWLGEGAWGVSGLLRQYASTGVEQLTAPADSRAFGFFTFQEIDLRRRGALQLGARVDRYSIASADDLRFGAGLERGFTAFSGSAGLTVPLANHVAAGLNFARSFRAPSVEELFSDALHIGTGAYEIGDPQLEPEYSQGFDLAVRARAARVSAEVSLYANTVANFIHFAERGDTVLDGSVWPVLAYVQSRAGFAGIEGQLEWVADRNLVLGVRGDLVRGTLDGGTPVPFLPPARLGGSVRWEGGRFGVGGGVRHAFAQERVGLDEETPTPAYTLVDLDVGLRLNHGGRVHSLTLRADNLLDALYRDATSRIKDFAPNPGRNLALLYRVYF